MAYIEASAHQEHILQAQLLGTQNRAPENVGKNDQELANRLFNMQVQRLMRAGNHSLESATHQVRGVWRRNVMHRHVPQTGMGGK
jgi:hypothetical protein